MIGPWITAPSPWLANVVLERAAPQPRTSQTGSVARFATTAHGGETILIFIGTGRRAPTSSSTVTPAATLRVRLGGIQHRFLESSHAEGHALSTALAEAPPFAKLNGSWLRPDGGYVLEIRGAAAAGSIQAAYLNPRPIDVARAEASREGSVVKIFVELRAPGYPASTYTLTDDPARDQLVGAYFQAALGQTFDVFFTRIK